MSQLLPEGIAHLGDCPYPLHRAIVDALRVLSYEEFPVEERPPKRIWEDGEGLREWWKQVDAKRTAKFKGESPQDEGDYEENALELISRAR